MRLIYRLVGIWRAYSPLEAIALTVSYIGILIENRRKLPTQASKFLSFTASYPSRATFFSQFTELFLGNAYHPPKESRLIVDCGSNIGMSALYFAWQCPRAEIICFEPNPEALVFLRKNIDSNGVNAKVVPVAVGMSDVLMPLYVESAVSASTGASLFPVSISQEQKTLSIKVQRLSTYLDKPIDYLKLDVEGAEYDVVKELIDSGAIKRISALCIECHAGPQGVARAAEALRDLLDMQGFSVHIRQAPISSHTLMLDAHRKNL